MSVFSDILAKTKLPEAALAPIEKALVDAFELVTENNKRVAQVNASKAQDPKKPGYEDYLDNLWRQNATDPAIREDVEQFDIVSEEYERLLSKLRGHAKANFIPEELSEEKARETRKLVNESENAVKKAREIAASMAAVADQMLTLHSVEIKGGVMSLIPEIDSLKSLRGRKATSGSGTGPYMTRAAEILVDGKSTNRDGKGKFNYAADDLSKRFNVERFPGNRVTAEELESAYLAEFGYSSREDSKSDNDAKLADREFTFTREIEVQNPNDDSTTKVPQTVSISVKRAAKVETETETAEPAEKKNNEDKAKDNEGKAETNSAPAPAKVTAEKKVTPAKK